MAESNFCHLNLLQPNDGNDMAPHPGIDPDQIKEKARKDLLDLLESVCKAPSFVRHVILRY